MSLDSRREKLRDLIDRLGLDALLIRKPANFAWYTGGADNRVDHTDPLGVAGILLTPQAEYVLTDNIEAPRMREEQTPGFEVVEHPWHEGFSGTLRALIGDSDLGTDFAAGHGREVGEEISPLRYILDSEAIERYRSLGADAVVAISEATAFLGPDIDEREASASLAAACRRRGMFSPVLLAASEARIGRYRHPIPHSGALGRRAMLVACAERGGLYANLTRIIDFEEPDPRPSAGRTHAT